MFSKSQSISYGKIYQIIFFSLLLTLFAGACSKDNKAQYIAYKQKMLEWVKTPEYEKLYISDGLNGTHNLVEKFSTIANSFGFKTPDDLAKAQELCRDDKTLSNINLEIARIEMALEFKIEEMKAAAKVADSAAAQKAKSCE